MESENSEEMELRININKLILPLPGIYHPPTKYNMSKNTVKT